MNGWHVRCGCGLRKVENGEASPYLKINSLDLERSAVKCYFIGFGSLCFVLRLSPLPILMLKRTI